MARPGRPPIGDRAMTSTERSRRRRDRLRANKPATKYATKSPGEDATGWQAEIAARQARIRELETELRRERELRETAETKAAKAAPRDNKDEQIAELETRLRALNEIASHFAQQGQKGPPVRFTPKEYKLLRACLHPDRVLDPDESKKYDRAFKLLEERLPEKFFVVKPPPARPAPPDLPRTREEMMAARLRMREENRARAKRAAATRAAKRAPRRSIEKSAR